MSEWLTMVSFVTNSWLRTLLITNTQAIGEGAPPAGCPPSTTDENKSTRTSPAWGGKVADLSKEKGQEPIFQWALIGFSLHWGIQVKLISHCQAVRIKQ